MHELFSRELLADIHIRLDQEGLKRVTEKELSVLPSETISNSATFVVEQLGERLGSQTEQLIEHLDSQTEQLGERLDSQTEQLIEHLDSQTEQLGERLDSQTEQLIEQLGERLDSQTEQLIGHLDSQTKQLMAHAEKQTDRIVQHIDAQTGQLMKHSEIQTNRIVQELKPIRELQFIRADLAYSRFWTKIVGGGVWAVAASLIANLLFQILTK